LHGFIIRVEGVNKVGFQGRPYGYLHNMESVLVDVVVHSYIAKRDKNFGYPRSPVTNCILVVSICVMYYGGLQFDISRRPFSPRKCMGKSK
jgi:hypothetical protein